jgi:hypothetical protein
VEYQNIKNALDTLLESASAGRFSVLGVAKRSHDAENVLDLPKVTSYYANGEFPKSKGSVGGPFGHDVTIKIDLLATAAAHADLSVLNDPNAAPEELAAALAASTDAVAEADAALDALVAIIWDVIMRPENRNLGLAYNPQRWVTGFQKNDPTPKGALVLISGTLTMTATALEYPTSEVGVPGASIDTTTPITADVTGATLDLAKQGVKEGE